MGYSLSSVLRGPCRARQARDLGSRIDNQHDPGSIQRSPCTTIGQSLLADCLGHEIPSESRYIRDFSRFAGPIGAEKITRRGTDGRDQESRAMLLVVGLVSLEELLHTEQEVGGVDPSPEEREEMLDQLFVA